jgi:Macrocin-O-methyltransferase (TylF)
VGEHGRGLRTRRRISWRCIRGKAVGVAGGKEKDDLAGALAHIDCDSFEPIRLCLGKWYLLPAPGGFIHFDGYDASSECRKAVGEFLSQHEGVKWETIQGTARVSFLRKPKPTS